MRETRIEPALPARARAQARWIAAMEPWRALRYRAASLGRYLARAAADGELWIVAETRRGGVLGVVVVTDGFLLGGFIALLAVKPGASGHGLGKALVDHVAERVFAKRRWLFVSCDASNLGALRFYRKLGFSRVGKLPDLVRVGRVEILLRMAAPPTRGSGKNQP